MGLFFHCKQSIKVFDLTLVNFKLRMKYNVVRNQSATVVTRGYREFTYALVNVFHPDWLVRSNFRLRRSGNLHKDAHQRVKNGNRT